MPERDDHRAIIHLSSLYYCEEINNTMPPVGFKRSRAIWDETRRPHLTTQQTIHAWIAAIAYEVQPIRLSDSNRRQFFRSIHKWILLFLSGIQSLPGLVKSLASFLASRTRREWAIAGAIFGYYLLVRWIHEYVLYEWTLYFSMMCCVCVSIVVGIDLHDCVTKFFFFLTGI